MIIIWNAAKAEENYKKHGIDFIEARSVLESEVQFVLTDSSHSEERFIALGFSASLRLLVVIYNYRMENVIRIISARKATRKERETYEKRI